MGPHLGDTGLPLFPEFPPVAGKAATRGVPVAKPILYSTVSRISAQRTRKIVNIVTSVDIDEIV